MHREVKEFLTRFDQEHLAQDLSRFTEEEIAACLSQLRRWELEDLSASWEQKGERHVFEPFLDPGSPSPVKGAKRGAAVFLAGGQGSRLGFEGPKGCYPILGKTLFQRHFEKMRPNALAAVLTSRLNHQETLAYFDRQNRFGLQKLFFFSQDTLPLLNEEGKWFWSTPGQIAEGPDGNGSVFAALGRSGVLQQLEDEGIELLHIVPVDNPLADPFDPELAAFHEASGADLSLKCIRLEESEEPMGRLVRTKGKLATLEFAELTAEQRVENRFANTGLLILDLSLARELARKDFPLHWAWKSRAWKAERFITDALGFAERPCALFAERNSCYAPLKEKKSIGEIERLLVV